MEQTLIQQLTELFSEASPLSMTFIGAFAGALAAYEMKKRDDRKKLRNKYLDLLYMVREQLNKFRGQNT